LVGTGRLPGPPGAASLARAAHSSSGPTHLECEHQCDLVRDHLLLQLGRLLLRLGLLLGRRHHHLPLGGVHRGRCGVVHPAPAVCGGNGQWAVGSGQRAVGSVRGMHAAAARPCVHAAAPVLGDGDGEAAGSMQRAAGSGAVRRGGSGAPRRRLAPAQAPPRPAAPGAHLRALRRSRVDIARPRAATLPRMPFCPAGATLPPAFSVTCERASAGLPAPAPAPAGPETQALRQALQRACRREETRRAVSWGRQGSP
jgi:hypothetical protein